MAVKLTRFEVIGKETSVPIERNQSISTLTNNVIRVYCRRQSPKWNCSLTFWRDGVFQNAHGTVDVVRAKDAYVVNGSTRGNFDASYVQGDFEKGDGRCALKTVIQTRGSYEVLECNHVLRTRD